MIRLELPVPPSANRWWRRIPNTKKLMRSREATNYLALVRARLWQQRTGPLLYPEGAVIVLLRWYRSEWRGDLDKRVPILLDSLQGLVYANDNQVWLQAAQLVSCPRGADRVVVVVLSPGEDGAVGALRRWVETACSDWMLSEAVRWAAKVRESQLRKNKRQGRRPGTTRGRGKSKPPALLPGVAPVSTQPQPQQETVGLASAR